MAAVALTPVAGFANREWHPAPAANQQVQHYVRHQALAHGIRPRAEWTAERGGVILKPLTSSRPAPAVLTRRGFFFAGATISHIPRTYDAASPRMMMGWSARRPHVRFLRFSTAVHNAGAFNLGRLLRHLVGIGTPRALQGRSGALLRLLLSLYRTLRPMLLAHASACTIAASRTTRSTPPFSEASERRFTTGC
jgi:hypothetical protein